MHLPTLSAVKAQKKSQNHDSLQMKWEEWQVCWQHREADTGCRPTVFHRLSTLPTSRETSSPPAMTSKLKSAERMPVFHGNQNSHVSHGHNSQPDFALQQLYIKCQHTTCVHSVCVCAVCIKQDIHMQFFFNLHSSNAIHTTQYNIRLIK